MTKNNPGKYNCYEKAKPDEPMFILLARDPVAPTVIRMWVKIRILLSNNDQTDKLLEALDCADEMEKWLKNNPQD